MNRSTCFQTLQKLHEALELFRSRGYRIRKSFTVPLWPGEVRIADVPEPTLEWRALDEDPAAPLWELLRDLDSSRSFERLGYALTLLVDRGLPVRQVVHELLQETPSCPS